MSYPSASSSGVDRGGSSSDPSGAYLRRSAFATSSAADPYQRGARPAAGAKWQQPPIPQPPLIPPLAALVEWLTELPPVAEWPTLLIDRIILAPLSSLLLATRDVILSPRTHRIVVRLGVLGAIFWTALAAAVISYVGFYRAWVPEVGLRKDVWLQYGHEEPPFCDLRFDGPELDGRNTGYRGEFFAEDQAYDVTLELGVPLNEANMDLGNFMVQLDLLSRSEATVFRASRPTLLTYSTAPVRALSSISQLISRNPPPSRSPPNSQILSVPLLRRVVLRPSTYSPPLSSVAADPKSDKKVTHGRVTVGRHDAERYWRYGGGGGGFLPANAVVRRDNNLSASRASRGELQTYAASLRFDAHLTGLRFFMYHYPLLSFFLFTSLFMGFELATALTLWALAAIYTSSITPQSLSLDTEEHFQTERPTRRRGAGVKSETTPSDYTGGETESLKRSDVTESDAETETETETAGTRVKREESQASQMARFKTEEDEDAELLRLRSLDSLRARDAAERAEAIRSARMRDIVENRRMAGGEQDGEGADDLMMLSEEFPPEVNLPRRVLGRLDEETEEETEVGGSVSGESASLLAGETGRGDEGEGGGEERWEDLDADEAGAAVGRAAAAKGDPSEADIESTVGESATSGPSSVRSFGATSVAPSVSTLQSRTSTRRGEDDE